MNYVTSIKKCFDIWFALEPGMTALKWKKRNESKISNFHNQKNLRFKAMPVSDLNRLDKTLIHHSPSRHGRQGSRYYVAIINNRPAYVRVSNHWGYFSTRGKWDDENYEYESVGHNWELDGGKKDKDGFYSHNSQAGYIYLE